MPEETLVVCPNPRCKKEIEPITLTVLSLARPKEYEACPHCFARIDDEPATMQEELPEPTIEEQKEFMDNTEEADLLSEEEKESAASIVERVRALIPRSDESQKETKEKVEPPAEPSIEEPAKEPEVEQTTKEPPQEQTAAKETAFTGCKNQFGYLAKRDPNTPIPAECMLCPKIVDCMLKI